MVAKNYARWAHILPDLNKEKALVVHHPALRCVSPHNHLFFELTYILDGTVSHTIDGRKSTLYPGDYFIMDYGSTHSYETSGDATFSNLDCLFLPELIDPGLRNNESLQDIFSHYLIFCNLQALPVSPTQMTFHDTDGTVLNILRRMQAESETKAPGYREMIRCHLIEIILLTIRRIDNASVAYGKNSVSAYLVNYIAEHYAENISLTELAFQLHYSLPYVSKCFKDETGMTFVAYLQSYRIRQASRMLLSTKLSIPEIAEAVGYRDVKFFTQIFKAATGQSPVSFRKLR